MPWPPSTRLLCTLSALVSADRSSVTWATAQACSTSVRMPCGALGSTSLWPASSANATGRSGRSLLLFGPMTHSASSISGVVWMLGERSAP